MKWRNKQAKGKQTKPPEYRTYRVDGRLVIRKPKSQPPRQPTVTAPAANALGKARRVDVNGRPFLVAPVVMLLADRVVPGSPAPAVYPRAVLANSAGAWNGMPVIIRHPARLGESARTPAVLESATVGSLYNAAMDGSRLVAEAWLDEQLLETLAPDVHAAVLAGRPLEVSTGLYGQFTADRTALAVMPDHLAILPDEVGACSLADGCGLLVARAQPQPTAPMPEPEPRLTFAQLDAAFKSLLGAEALDADKLDGPPATVLPVPGRAFRQGYGGTRPPVERGR
jgi:hypothetical protein